MAEPKNTVRIEISSKTVIFIIGVVAGIWFLIQIKEIIILTFIAIIILSALLKPVEWLTTKGIPRVLSVILLYLTIISVISLAVAVIIPPLISQTTEFVSRFPQIASSVNDFFIFHQIPMEDISSIIARQLQSLVGNVISIFSKIFSSIFLLLTLLVLSFYFLLEWKTLVKLVSSPFSGKQEKKVSAIVTKVEHGLGKWIRGQLTLSVVVGIMSFIGLSILGFPYAIPLAIIAGILEIIPIIGPIISAIPAILVGLTLSPILALAAAALYLIIQQAENNLIVPLVMSKVVGLKAPIIIIALLIGSKLAGVGGAFLAVPVLVVIRIIIQEVFMEDQKLEEELIEQ